MSTLLVRKISRLSPHNVHPLPIAEAWDGKEWTVDLSIRDGTLDVDGTASHEDLTRAQIKAFSRLKKSKTMFEKYGYIPN